MTRDEHVQWCKERALEYCDNGDLVGAWTSMASDLNSHAETRNHLGIELGTMLMLTQSLNTKATMRKFIEDFR